MSYNETLQLMYKNIQEETADEFWVAVVKMGYIKLPITKKKEQ